jgi:hypothetical protein
MKLTPSRIKFLDFMSGTGGRLVRGSLGVLAISGAALSGGWYWLLAPLGIFMIVTGVVNYCPATLAFPQYNGEKIADKYPAYKLKK